MSRGSHTDHEGPRGSDGVTFATIEGCEGWTEVQWPTRLCDRSPAPKKTRGPYKMFLGVRIVDGQEQWIARYLFEIERDAIDWRIRLLNIDPSEYEGE